ncbi:hypothetical protein [Muriicola sp. Z0-33]|uniref:hypothetical protein n=1 Tax=Muriicola sp. Z0-33 TaxID=2816957 RepID=UPI0022382757|nr:hypothetical protein [Muriicola sp. Z0-33]MCW5516881.1 hypothetical protein [Muriicola sp. Z0-33]
MKNIINQFKIILLCFFISSVCGNLYSQDGRSVQVISNRLRAYYVGQPNTDTRAHPVAINNEGPLFGGNPNMEIGKQLLQAIYFGGGENDQFRANVARILSHTQQHIAVILYDDTNDLREDIGDTWTNCVRNRHFFACATQDEGTGYSRVVHLGASQMNEEGIETAKRGFLRLLSGSSSITGWWDQLERPTSIDSLDVCIPYVRNYEVFRRSVVMNSEEIRHGMVHRSNPEHAERVIDRRQDLRSIHRGYMDAGVREGQNICLTGYMMRDERRWVALIRFRTREVHTFRDDIVEGEINRPEQIRTTIEHARRVAAGISQENPRIRINCMLDLFERLGPERAWNQMTADKLGVALFIDMSEIEKGRRLARGIPPPEYEFYPLRQIVVLLQGQQRYRENDELYREALKEIDFNIHRSISAFHRALASGSNIYGPNFYRLRDWIRERQFDTDHVYSCYNQSD